MQLCHNFCVRKKKIRIIKLLKQVLHDIKQIISLIWYGMVY